MAIAETGARFEVFSRPRLCKRRVFVCEIAPVYGPSASVLCTSTNTDSSARSPEATPSPTYVLSFFPSSASVRRSLPPAPAGPGGKLRLTDALEGKKDKTYVGLGVASGLLALESVFVLVQRTLADGP